MSNHQAHISFPTVGAFCGSALVKDGRHCTALHSVQAAGSAVDWTGIIPRQADAVQITVTITDQRSSAHALDPFVLVRSSFSGPGVDVCGGMAHKAVRGISAKHVTEEGDGRIGPTTSTIP